MRDRIERFWQAIDDSPIQILVWGPGRPPRGTPPAERKGWEKRLQIRRELKHRFPEAGVFFSEDREMRDLTTQIDDQLLKQAVHARAADIVLILNVSRGSDVEVDHFINAYDWFPRRCYVLLPERYIGSRGLAVIGVLSKLPPGHLIGYSQADFTDCRVATEMAVRIAWQAATRYWLTS